MSNLFSKEDLSQLSDPISGSVTDPPVKKKKEVSSLFTEEDLKAVKGDFFGALTDISLASSSSSAARVVDLPDDYGASQYDAGVNYAHQLNNLNEFRAQSQPLYDKVGNSMVKLVGGTALNTAGAGATLLGAPKALMTWSLEPLWNNSAARFIDSLTEDMQESFPHYYMQAEKEKSALGQVGTYNFWGDQFVNGLSFLTGAALTGGLTNVALKGMSLGAKAAMSNRMFNSMRSMKYLRNMTGQGIVKEGADLATKRMWSDILSTSAHLATGAVYESGLEARMGYDSTLDLALENPEYRSMFEAYEQSTGTPPTREEKLKMIPAEDRKNMVDMAVGLSNMQFAGNMFLVGSGNAIMLGGMYGPGMKRMFRSAGKAAGKVEDLAIKGIKKTGLGDVGAARVVGTGKWAVRGVHEGFVEEGGQGVLARMSEHYAYNAARSGKQFELDLGEYIGGFGEAVSETIGTKEGQTEIGLGFLLGLMGMPKAAGGSGMFMSGSIAETSRKLTAKNNLEEFKKKLQDKFLEHKKTHPEKYLNQAHAAFLAKQLHGRVEARILAEKEGRVFDAKNLEEDDFFDHMFYLNETGQLEDAMKMFEEGMKMDPDSFKEVYGYDPAMPLEDLNLRKEELKRSFSDRVARFKKVADMIDSSFPMTFEEKYANVDDVNNIGSSAGRRRFMMRYASKAEENDKREKQIIAELAKMTGGEVQFAEDSDMVDEIVYRQTDGKIRVARMGTLNLNASVAGQLMETRQRIADIERVNPERRPVAMQEDLEGLREFEKVLSAEKDMTQPLIGILLESKRDVEMESLDALFQRDPIAATANQNEIIQKLDDLRKLRIQRKQFTDMFIAASAPETFEEMLRVQREVVEKVEKELEVAKAEAVTALEEVNTAISDMQERIRAYKAVGYADLEERLEELKEAMARTGDTLQMKIASVAGIEENIAELSAEMPELKAEFNALNEKIRQLEAADEAESVKASRMLFDPPGYVLGALELIEKDEPIVRQQLNNVKEASSWLYQEYKRINFLIQEGRLPVSEHYAKRIVSILARDIEALEAYVIFDAERSDSAEDLSFLPTLKRIDRNLKERLRRLDKKLELYSATTARKDLRKGMDSRKITMAELKADLAVATREKDVHEEEFNAIKGKVGVARQELNDMLKATDLLSMENVTENDLERFIEAVQAAENMFVEEGEELEYFNAGTEGSEVLMRRYVQAKRQLDEDVQGTIDMLNQRVNDTTRQLEVLKAQIATAEALIASATKDLVTTLTELQKTDPALAAELENVYAGDIRLFVAQRTALRDELLSNMEKYTAELAEIQRESDTIRRDYMRVRMVDVFQRVMAAPDMSDMSEVEEMPFTAENAEEDFDALIDAERPGRFLPSIDIGFHKSTSQSHSAAINRHKQLSAIKDRTQEEQVQLDRVDNIIRWYKWLQNPEDMDNWIESKTTRMLVFSERSVPDALKERMAGTFYLKEGETESQELKMVPVRVSADGSYELILEEGKFIYASMMDADLETSKGTPRFHDLNQLSEDGKKKMLNSYKAERERLLALDNPVLIRPFHGSSGVPITKVGDKKNPLLPINDVMSVIDLAEVPLKISMPSTSDKGTRSTVVEFPGATGSVVAGVGKVFAYDSKRRRYIPMERSLLSQEDSVNVARMYHLMLKTYLQARAAGVDHITARKGARDLDLWKGVTLRSQIRDIIHEHWDKDSPSEYQIMSRLENSHIIFGLEGKITIADFEAKNHVYEAFMKFLANKRYHVKADTLAGNKSWNRVQLKEDLTVKVIDSYPNYTKFLLTPVNGKAPVMSRMSAYKTDSKLTPASVGGYLVYSSTDLSEERLSTVDRNVALQDMAPRAATPIVTTASTPSTLSDPNPMAGSIDALSRAFEETPADEDTAGGPSERQDVVFTGDNAAAIAALKGVTDPTEEASEKVQPRFHSLIYDKEDGLTLTFYLNNEQMVLEEPSPSPDGNYSLEYLTENMKGDINFSDLSTDLQEEVMTAILIETSMRTIQADSPVFNAIQESVTEEIARAQKMTPIQVTHVQTLLGRLDDPAVAQLRGYGDVLLSSFAPAGGVYHEAFHNVSLYVLTPNDRKVLYGKVRQLEGEVQDYLGNIVNFNTMSDTQADEWLAEEFRKWLLSGMTRKVGQEGIADDRNIIQRFFDSIRLLLRRLFNLNDRFEFDPDVKSIDGFFKELESGRFLHAVPAPIRAIGSDVYMRTRPDGVSMEQVRDFQHMFFAEMASLVDLDNLDGRNPTLQQKGIHSIADVYQAFAETQLPGGKFNTLLSLTSVSLQKKLVEKDRSLAEGSLEKEALKGQLDLIGRNINELLSDRTKVARIKSMLNSYLQDMKFVEVEGEAAKNEGKEDDERTIGKEEEEAASKDVNWDREFGDTSVIGMAGKEARFLFGTIVKKGRVERYGMNGLYDLTEVLNAVQVAMKDARDWKDILSRAKEMSTDPVHPWGMQVLRRLEKLHHINRDKSAPLDTTAYLFRQQISSQLRKTVIAPFETLVSSDGRISSIDPAQLRTQENIKDTWKKNLQAKRPEFIRMDGSKMVFVPTRMVTLEGKNPESMSNLLARLPKIQSARELIEIAGVFGITFSRPEALTPKNLTFEGETVGTVLRESLNAILTTALAGGEINMFDRSRSDEMGRANRLARLEFRYGSRTQELGYTAADGKSRYSVSDPPFLAVAGGRSYNQSYLSTEYTSYAENSLVAQHMKENPDVPLGLEVVILQGLKDAEGSVTGEKVAKLSTGDLLVMHVNALMDGVTVMPRPADKGTELGAKLPIWNRLPAVGEMNLEEERTMNVLKGYLEDEIVQAIRMHYNYDHIEFVPDAKHSLRMFKGLLSEKTLAVIDKKISGARPSRPTDITVAEEARIRASVKAFLNTENAEKSIILDMKQHLLSDARILSEYLAEMRLVEMEGNNVRLLGLDPGSYGSRVKRDRNGYATLPVDLFNDIVLDLSLRHFIGKNEMFKAFLGDPAVYVSLFKRLGGSPGPKMMMDTDQSFITHVTETSGGRLPRRQNTSRPTGRFVTIDEFRGKVDRKMLEAFKSFVQEQEVINAYNEKKGKEGKGVTDKADGTIWVTSDFMRMASWGTGQWSAEKEEAYQEMVQGISPKIQGGSFAPEKFQFFGPAMVGGKYVPAMFKMSSVPLDETLGQFNGRKYVNYLNMLRFLRENEIDGVVIPSAFKFGKQVPEARYHHREKNRVVTYDEGIQERNRVDIDLAYFGSQQKIGQSFKGKTMNAVQAQAHIGADLFEQGKVIPGMEAAARMVDEFNTVRAELVRRGMNDMLRRLQIERTPEGYGMTAESYSKVLDFLEEQGTAKEIGEFLLSAVKTLRTFQDPKFEMFVDPKAMERVLMGGISKQIIRQKRRGDQLIQMSEAGYEVAEIDGKLVDTSLGFYQNPSTGNWVAEVRVPNFMRDLVGRDLNITPQGIMSEGKLIAPSNMLEAIGIRIPTDGLHSIETIRIVEFLPDHAGPVVMIPHMLLIKSGSDFDIDKLVMYFRNHRSNPDGTLSAVPYFNSLEEWYNDEAAQRLRAYEVLMEKLQTELMEAPSEKDLALLNNLTETLFGNAYTDTPIRTREQLRVRMEKAGDRLAEFWITSMDGSLRLVPFESWRNLNPDIELENVITNAALENRMMDLMRDLITIPARATEFLRPVNTDLIKTLKKDLMENSSKNRMIPDLDNVKNLHTATSLPNIMRMSRAAFDGKSTVGIYALGGTHHIKAQKVGLQIDLTEQVQALKSRNPKKRLKKDAQINFQGFEDVTDTLSLSSVMNRKVEGTKRMTISNSMSQNVNSAVDNASNFELHVLNAGERTAPAVSFLLRAGVPMEMTAYFMNQPAVRDFTYELDRQTSRFLRVRKKSQSKYDIYVTLSTRYRNPGKTRYFFTLDQLQKMSRMSLEEIKKPGNEQLSEMQGQVLRDLLVYMALGEDLGNAVNAQSFDTKAPKSKVHAQYMVMNYRKVLASNRFPNLEKIVSESYLDPMELFSEDVPGMFKDMFITDSMELADSVRTELMRNFLKDDSYVSMDDAVKELERVEAGLRTWVLQNIPDADGVVVGRRMKELMYGTGSLPRKIASIQNGSLYEDLRYNFWINSMIPQLQSDTTIPDALRPAVKSLQPADKDALYDSFMEIYERHPELAMDIMHTAILQSGMLNSPFEILSMIPGELFAQWSQGVYRNFSQTMVTTSSQDFLDSYVANQTWNRNLAEYSLDAEGKTATGLYYVSLEDKARTGLMKQERELRLFRKNGTGTSEEILVPASKSHRHLLNLAERTLPSQTATVESTPDTNDELPCP
jgi:hypothetical protein